MTKKLIINPFGGGEDIGLTNNNYNAKDYNLEIAQKLKNKLNSNNVYLLRDRDETLSTSERINKLKNNYGLTSDVILLNIGVNEGDTEIIYALRNSDAFASMINNSLNNNGINVSKFYQRRLPSSPSKDYYEIIRESANNESIIVFLSNDFNDIDKVVNSLRTSINKYLGITSGDYYTVVKGDTLYSLAKKWNTSVDRIKSENNLSSDLLSLGQKLIIPTSTESSKYYIVKKGDTLYSIARANNTSVSNIKELNNLSSNLLSINQKLILPSKYYTVVKGDTLYSIAKRYNTTVSRIKDINNLSSNNLIIGQKLLIN